MSVVEAQIATAASVLRTVSMTALGLGVDVRVVAAAGARVTGATTASLVVLGMISFALIRHLGVARATALDRVPVMPRRGGGMAHGRRRRRAEAIANAYPAIFLTPRVPIAHAR